MDRVRSYLHKRMEQALQPVLQAMLQRNISPNLVSVLGMLFNCLAAALIVNGSYVSSGFVFIFAGLLDLLDGSLARLGKSASPQGAFLDSILDRISEGLVFAAVTYVFARQGAASEASLTALVLLGSLLVSYIRARAEALGVECRVGLATRAERVILVAIGLLFGILTFTLYVLAILTAITVAHRVFYTLNQLGKKE